MKVRFPGPGQFLIVGVESLKDFGAATTWLKGVGIYNVEWWGAVIKGDCADEMKPILALRFN